MATSTSISAATHISVVTRDSAQIGRHCRGGFQTRPYISPDPYTTWTTLFVALHIHGSIPCFLEDDGRRRAMKVLKNARLIDGTGASPVGSATIVIDGNRITEVTARNQGEFPADSEVIDVAGMTVLPGLIDCHDHMAVHRYDMM